MDSEKIVADGTGGRKSKDLQEVLADLKNILTLLSAINDAIIKTLLAFNTYTSKNVSYPGKINFGCV